MRRGIDTNILVYAHVAGTEEHEPVRTFLHKQLRSDDVQLVLGPMVLHEFVHVVTDPRRFEPPVTMSEATAVARMYLRSSNVEIVATDAQATRFALDLVDEHTLGRKRLADALLASTLLTHGVPELISCNRPDFEQFDGLDVIDPCST